MGTTARLWWPLREENIDKWDKIIIVCDEGENICLKDNYLELFDLLGIADRIEIIDKPTAYQEIIVPDIAYEHDVYYSSEMMETVRAIVSAALNKYSVCEQPGKPLFFTRSKIKKSKHNEVNVDILDRVFSNNGYEVIAPEKLSLSELIFKMNIAPEIITFSGSLAHNLIFAPKTARLYILERSAINNTFQISINLMTKPDLRLIDSFHLPLFAPFTGKVFLHYPTEQFIRFAEDKGLDITPFLNIRNHKRRTLKLYLKGYKREYGRLLGFEHETTTQISAIKEAYDDALKEFYPFLRGHKFICFTDALYKYYILRKLKGVVTKYLLHNKLIGRNLKNR